MKFFCFFVFLVVGCSSDSDSSEDIQPKIYKYLALGDSYTIGQSVCETCRFPIQLQNELKNYLTSKDVFITNIIAQTGWTTTNLKSAIALSSFLSCAMAFTESLALASTICPCVALSAASLVRNIFTILKFEIK